MDIETKLEVYLKAEIGLRESLKEKKNLGTLATPRLDWKIFSCREVSTNFRKQLEKQIDELVPTQKLYSDLYESI